MVSRKATLVASTMLNPGLAATALRLAVPALMALGLTAVSAHAQDGGTVEEVIVTSQKQVQNVQDVPIAVTAVTAQALQNKGITDVARLSNIAPNVTLDAGTPFSGSDTVLSAYIRGIGQNDFAFNQDPGVGVYIDGVYLARSVGANTSMLDVARVEILKGPQGTLFGRNTIGGAINIVTRDPGPEFMAKVEVTGGQFSRLDVRGTADMPLSDKVLTSLSFSESHRNGYQRRIPFPSSKVAAGIPDCVGAASCITVTDGYSTLPAAGYQTSEKEGGQNSWSVRAKAILLPSDNLKITLAGDYTNVDQSATASSAIAIDPDHGGLAGLYNACIGLPQAVLTSPAVNLGVLCNSPRLGLAGVPTATNPLPALGSVNVDGNPNNNRIPYDNRFVTGDIDTSYANGNSFSKLSNWGVSGIVDLALGGGANLRSVTAYRKLHWRVGMDLDGSPLDILHTSFDMPQHEFSEELQFLGKAFDDKLDYVFGAYFFKEGGHLHDYVTFPAALLMIDGPNDLNTRAEALFAHLNYRFTDQFSITLGGRYTKEHKTFEGHQTDDNGLAYKASTCYPPTASAALIGAPAGLTCQQALGFPNPGEPYRYYPAGVKELDFSNFSPRVGLEFKPNDDVMIYASYSKGFKTGSWTTRLSNPHPTYDASLHFDPEKATSEEVGIKSELFDRRMRLNIAGFHTKYANIQLNSQQGISPTLLNAGDARIWGFEVESEAVIGMGFSLTGSIGYTNAKYTHVNPGVGDNGVQVTTDYELPKTPKWKFNIGPQYIADLGDAGELQFNADWTHTTHLFNDLGNTALLERPATDSVNASMTYKAPGDHWELTVGATNLTDERYVVTGQNQGGVAVVFASYSEPREWFATARFRY